MEVCCFIEKVFLNRVIKLQNSLNGFYSKKKNTVVLNQLLKDLRICLSFAFLVIYVTIEFLTSNLKKKNDIIPKKKKNPNLKNNT